MTDKCKHVSRFNLGDNHSILNPQKWICADCESTESVWACLNCFHVGCGRFNQEHAVNHFKESTHPIAIEVNEKYVYCYMCDDYVLNDNAAGEIKLLRTMLSAIASQSFENLEGRSSRFMRSAFSSSSDSESAESVLRDADKTFTAFRHRRLTLLQKTFLAWRAYARYMKDLSTTLTPPKEVTAPISPKRKQVFTPGVTGLRNLGNTCYMNSIIQVLGHIPQFREFFVNMEVSHCNVYTRKPNKQNKIKKNSLPENNVYERTYARQTTMEAKQHVEHKDNESNKNKPENNNAKQHRRKQGGLNGGSSPSINTGIQKMQVEEKDAETVSLCHELHDLFRVLWSGKWAIVSPHSMLHAVWKAIPSFKGFAQQDAQEFFMVTELIERVHTELTSSLSQRRFTENLNRNCPRGWVYVPITTANQKCAHHTIVTEIFQGELVSEVSCIACGHKSHTYEPFWDLSLEFPDRYNILNSPDGTFSEESCDLTEMLAKFTEKESLEGNVYACDQCNSRRRSTSKKPLTYTSAYKSLMVHRLPNVLRLHLKRFRWAGRLHREKIKVHVNFKHKLNVQSYCNPASPEQSFAYELSGAIIHHGRGFGSGHYTCYCWNSNADSWIQCNDGRLEPYSEVDILSCQAYILFYSRARPAYKQSLHMMTQPQETLSNSDTNMTSRDDPSSEEDEEVTFKTPLKRQLYSSDDLDITRNDDGFCNEVKKQRMSI